MHATNIYARINARRKHKTPPWFIYGASVQVNEMWRYLFAEAERIGANPKKKD